MDHSGQTLGNNTPPSANKKRKLSDNESPSAKQLRTNAVGKPTQKPVLADGEHEVSSSSEAETHVDNMLLKPGHTVSRIDKFFRPKPKNSDQEEITSTNQDVEILDLTGEVSDESKTESNDEAVENKTGDVDKKSNTDEVAKKKNAVNCKEKVVSEKFEENGAKDTVKKEETEKTNEGDEESMDEDSDDEEEDDNANASFIANTSVCEDALKTPAKEKKLESVLKVCLIIH